jgi:hypothetical protein
VRIHDGRYECVLCGAILDIPLTDTPQVVIFASSGKPNMRTLMLDGRKLHSCAARTPSPTRERTSLP